MAPRPPVALVAGALACVALAGCGGGVDAGPTTATPSDYIAAVQRLVEPPAQLASSLEERGRAVTGPAPASGECRADERADGERDGRAGRHRAMLPDVPDRSRTSRLG